MQIIVTIRALLGQLTIQSQHITDMKHEFLLNTLRTSTSKNNNLYNGNNAQYMYTNNHSQSMQSASADRISNYKV